MRRCIRIGSRESRLAVVQTRLVADYIQEALPEAEVRLVTMKTTGDRILDRPLEAVGGKGLFVKELDRALLEGRTELSVHSLKDLPMDLPAELPILGYSRREDPRDVLVLPAGSDQWDRSKPLGCSSKRRILQLQRLYPEVRASLIRGNVQTRLRKLVWSHCSGGGGAEAAGAGGSDFPVFLPGGDASCGRPGHSGGAGPGGCGLRLLTWIF